MSALVLVNQVAKVIPTGSLIVIEDMEARVFNPETDFISDIIGVAYPPRWNSGRAYNALDGPIYYIKTPGTFQEDLSRALDEQGNPKFDADLRFPSPSFYYTIIVSRGMVPVIVDSPVPAHWKLLKTGMDYSWYFIP